MPRYRACANSVIFCEICRATRQEFPERADVLIAIQRRALRFWSSTPQWCRFCAQAREARAFASALARVRVGVPAVAVSERGRTPAQEPFVALAFRRRNRGREACRTSPLPG